MARMSNDELVNHVYNEIRKADGYEGNAISENIGQALGYYNRDADRFPAAAGRSQVVSGDVADMIHALLAHMDSALALNCQAEFEPKDEADEEQARIESAFCHDLIFNKSNGYVSVLSAVKDLLLMRNGILKVWVEENDEIETEEHEDISEEELAARMEMVEAEAGRSVELVSYDDGDAVLRITRERRTFRVEAVARENFLTEPNLDTIYLDGARFHAERILMTRTELMQSGVSKAQAKRLKPIHTETWPTSYRRNKGNETNTLAAEEPSMDQFEVFECVYRVDFDGDGEAELYRIRVCDHELLDKELVDFSHFCAGTGWLEPHQFHGLSVYDLLRDVQDQKTAFLRQWIDNATSANNRRLVCVENQTNMEDAVDSRADGVIRVTAQGAVMELQRTDIGPSCQAGLDYLDKVRSERAGASLDMVTAEAQVVGHGGMNGIERQFSSREMMAAHITRTVAETLIRSLFLLVHRTARSFMTGQHNFRTAGRWQATQPTTWKARTEVKVKVGMSAGERTKRVSSLWQNVQLQVQLVTSGSPLADHETLYRSVVDWARAAEVDVPENYYIDPASEEGQQAMQRMLQQGQATQQQQQAVMQAQLQLAQGQQQLEAAKVRADVQEAARKAELEWRKALLQSEVEEAKIVGKATADLQVAQMQMEAGANDARNGGAAGTSQT